MMLAITPQQLNQKGFTHLEHSRPIPKCHRKFRIAYAALDSDCPMASPSLSTAVGFYSSNVNTIVNKLYEVQKTLGPNNILLVTSGIRWNHRARAEYPSSVCLQVDCRHFSDPNETKDLRGHIGRHPRILKGLSETPAMRQMIGDALRFIDDHAGKKLVINLFCTSGRHRSVGAATLLYYLLDKSVGRRPLLVHFHSPEWSEMNCGGRCRSCGTADLGEIRNLMLPYLPNTTANASEPVGPPASEPSRPRVPEPAGAPPTLTPARVGAVPARIPSDPPPPPSRREGRLSEGSGARRDTSRRDVRGEASHRDVRGEASRREVRHVSSSDHEMTDVSRRREHDREAGGRHERAVGHGLTMQVLANQVNELSGLVRQVLDDRGRGRGGHRRRSRSDSRRRSRSRRARSSGRRGRSVPPPMTPPTPPPRSPASLTPYPEDQRQEPEQLLFQQLHGRDGKPLCWNPDEALLTLLVESVRLWSNRDRTLWLCDPSLHGH